MKALLLFGLLLVSAAGFSGVTETSKLGEDQVSLNHGVNCSGTTDYSSEGAEDVGKEGVQVISQ